MSITAKVVVQLLRAGAPVQIAAGDPLPELSADEARDLLDAGALDIDTLKAGFASQPDATRAGAGSPGTNTTQLDTSPARPDESVPELAREPESAVAPAARKPRSK